MGQREVSTFAGEVADARNGGGHITAEQVGAQLEKIFQSAGFQRSERLQRFLRFVCDETLKGEGQGLHEYLIGTEVFGRGADYSPNTDGIVRRQAHALRRKLQEYYEAEGAGDPLRIDLPVGRYVPLFRRNGPEAVEAIAPQVVPQREQYRFRPLLFAVALILFAAGWVAGNRSVGTSGPISSAPPEVRELWGPWFAHPEGATICFSNPLTAVVKQYPQPLQMNVRPERQLLTAEQDRMFRSVLSLPPGGHLYIAPALAQTKMGEAFAAVSITSLFAGAGLPVRATQSRFVTWEDLTRENVILLGHNEANPWIDRILGDLPLRLATNEPGAQRMIVNAKPGPGEASAYEIQYGEDASTATQEYALVSMLPGVDGQHQLLLINGLNTQATQIAAEYLTTTPHLQQLLAELRKKDPGHRGPWQFQAVLRTEVHDKVPTKAALVNLKVIRER